MIEFTLVCDDCGGIIHASRKSARAARAEAQLQCSAYCGQGVDRCASCRLERGKALLEQIKHAAPSHSISACQHVEEPSKARVPTGSTKQSVNPTGIQV
jgi:hypothetical protein